MKIIFHIAVAACTIVSCSKSIETEPENTGFAEEARAPINSQRGMLYTMSNAVVENMILACSQNANGSLEQEAFYSANGMGTGVGLGSQGALAVSGNWLFAVNAGSSTIASFAIDENGNLHFADTIYAGGERPVSIAAHNNRIYVANSQSSSISGFTVNGDGVFSNIPNSRRPLSKPVTDPGQISFTPDGRMLIVTEKLTNTLTSFVLDINGVPSSPFTLASAGETPYGFDFVGSYMVVSEEKSGLASQSTASSYGTANGTTIISGPFCAEQTSASRVAAHGQTVYIVNSGSNTISSFTMNNQGMLQLKEKVAAGTGNLPVDVTINRSGKTLYEINSGSRSIGGYKISGNHSLSKIGELTNLPPAASGLVAY